MRMSPLIAFMHVDLSRELFRSGTAKPPASAAHRAVTVRTGRNQEINIGTAHNPVIIQMTAFGGTEARHHITVKNPDLRFAPDEAPRLRGKLADAVPDQFVAEAPVFQNGGGTRGVEQQTIIIRLVHLRGGGRRFGRKTMFSAPFPVRLLLQQTADFPVMIEPFVRMSTGEDIRANAIGMMRFAIREKCVQVTHDRLFPARIGETLGQMGKTVAGLVCQTQLARKPFRRIQIHHADKIPETGFLQIVDLTVQRYKIIRVEPAPDCRILRIGLSQGIRRIPREKTDRVNTRIRKTLHRPELRQKGTVSKPMTAFCNHKILILFCCC